MARKSFTPLIETTLSTFPDLKDNYKKLAQKVGCCTKTIKRYFEKIDSKVPSDNINISANPPLEQQFIDDPDELLMSVAIRELNRSNPDPRWASILITTRKENIGQSKKEGKIRFKFKSMNIKDIAKISSGKPIDTSQKPDLEESS